MQFKETDNVDDLKRTGEHSMNEETADAVHNAFQ